MPDLEPITRTEKLWSGKDLDPVTRKEMYIKHLYDETQVIPDHPVTREEMFILKAGEELHDVTIEQLTATENGTYSEQGVAYSPVIVEVPEPTLITKSITENGTYSAEDDNADGYSSVDVNVPLPENAYLLKSVTTPTPIASFNDGEDMVMPTLKVAIEPQQDLHGYDAPWVGGAGKNKANIADMNVQSQTTMGRLTLPSGTYVASATVKNNTSIGGTIKINTSSENIATGAIPSASGTSRVNTNSFTLSESTEVIVVISGTASGYNYDVSQVQIESGSTATSFAPYSNICPISGHTEANVTRTGKNLANLTYGNKVPSVTTGEMVSVYGWSSDFFKLDKSKEYVVSATTPSRYLLFYDANKTYLGYIVTYASDGYKLSTNQYWDNAVYIKNRSDATSDTTPNIQLEVGTTATTYEPYAGTTYTIDLDGTRYGGELDVVSGVLTVDRAYVDIGSMTYSEYGSTSDCTQYYTTALDSLAKSNSQVISDIFVYGETVIPWTMRITAGTQGKTYFRTTKDLYESPSAFKTAMNGHQLVYELATPQTIQLTPTAVKSLLGSNNVWANTGDITDAEYFSKEV